MTEARKPSITPAPNGPYLVKAVDRLSNRNGALQAGDSIALCRCGASANKPFCDGSHKKTGFTSDKEDGRQPDRRRSYAGKKITIHDNRGVCAHAGYCTDGLASVFRMHENPWIAPDAAAIEDVISTIRRCPSGALDYSIEDDTPEPADAEPSIHIEPDGPYVVSGVELANTALGDGVTTRQYTLCRCGASKNKPFCDGSHWNIGFSDDKN